MPCPAVDVVRTGGGHLEWDLGDVHAVPARPVGAAAALDAVMAGSGAEWLLFWDPALGAPPGRDIVAELTAGRADVAHAGLALGAGGALGEIDYVQPTWWFAVDPPAGIQAMSWRATWRAMLVRRDVVRDLGHVDPAFASMDGAALDMGWRYLARGAMVVHEPRLAGTSVASGPVVDVAVEDRYLFLLRHYAPKWARYAMARRCLVAAPWREARAFRTAQARVEAVPPPARPGAVFTRRPAPAATAAAATMATATARPRPRISVVLPTLGRYDLVAAVLGDLGAQTVAPDEVICVDQNPPAERRPELYERFADLGPEVIWQDERGQWRARNAAVERSTGDLLLFVDDDSRIGPDFVERHLDAMSRFGADVSAGASLSVVGAPVPESYAFFRVADQFDSGNAMVRREVMARVGAFDRHYDRMRAGDTDFGMRVYLAGGLLVHNPEAWRSHLKAATGGLRTFGSWDSYRQLGLLTPRPLPSVVYYSLRYFSARQTREGLLIGLLQSAVPYHLKRRATGRQWARFLAVEAALLPLSAVRVARSVRAARRMLAAGPRIPAVGPALVGTPVGTGA